MLHWPKGMMVLLMVIRLLHVRLDMGKGRPHSNVYGRTLALPKDTEASRG